MKRTILIFWILVFGINLSFSQKSGGKERDLKGFVKTGTGFFADVFFEKFEPGQTLWTEGGVKLSNDLLLSAEAAFSYVKSESENIWGGHKDAESILFYQDYSLNIGYEITIRGGHKFTPSLGVLYDRLSNSSTDVYVDNNNNLIIEQPVYIDQELGLNLNLDYYYQFKSNFFLGARANVVYLLSIGFENIAFTPVVGVKF